MVQSTEEPTTGKAKLEKKKYWGKNKTRLNEAFTNKLNTNTLRKRKIRYITYYSCNKKKHSINNALKVKN